MTYEKRGHYYDNGYLAIHEYGDCEQHGYKEMTRKNCAPDFNCWEKGPYKGPTKNCKRNKHVWELNVYRTTRNHYHCLWCGVGADLTNMQASWDRIFNDNN